MLFRSIAFINIARSEFLSIRILWLIASLFSTCLCSWFIFRNLSDYLSYSVVTKTLVKHETGLIFPIIGLCNLNQIIEVLRNQNRDLHYLTN